MKGKATFTSVVVMVLLAGLVVGGSYAQEAGPQAALGTGFTYQGQLKGPTGPINGLCDLRFRLFDAASGGIQVGSTVTHEGVGLEDGLFTALLDFGPGAFPGDARWLAVEVRCPAGAGSYTSLSPRQPLTPGPYALYAAAAPWAGLAGVPAGFADGVDNNTTYSAGTGLTLSGTTFSANTTYLQRRVSGTCGSGNAIRVVNADGTVACEPVGGAANAWLLAGNAGTTPGTQFLGTTDSAPLEIKVNGARVLRLEPPTGSEGPNLIGGYSGNSVTAGVVGATISGGGTSGFQNQVTDNYGTVGGGQRNRAGNDNGTLGDARFSTVAGGVGNVASFDSATVGGGWYNTASGQFSIVGGGRDNVASAASSVVAGGDTNTASGWRSTVAGGVGNVASGEHSFAAGRRAKALHDGAFVWADAHDADFVSDANNEFLVRAYNGVKIVRGASTYSASQSALQVDQAAAAEAGWFYVMNAENPYTVLKVAKDPAAPSTFVDGVDRTSEGVETRRFHIAANGAYVAGSDFAESLPVAGDPADYEPGDVLVISLERPGGIEKSGQPYDGRVLGVYSTRPGFLGADKDGVTEVMAGEVPVAILGIVPVKVSAENGPIQPGDLLTTSSTPGHAMRCVGLELCFGRTLGKALEGLTAGQSTGVIRVLVSLQ